MEELMSNNDLIWMSIDDIFTHENISKPYLMSHKLWPVQCGFVEFIY